MITMPGTSEYHVSKAELAIEERQVLAAKKDRSEFAALYNKYYEQIFRYIYQRLDSEDEAADITSQVFVKAMVNLAKYELRGLPFSSWLYRIAKNELNLFFRSKKSSRTVNTNTDGLGRILEEMEEEDEFQQKMDQVVEALRELLPEQVEIIEMRFFERRSFKEVGEILNITENYSKVKVYRVLEELRDIISSKTGNHGQS